VLALLKRKWYSSGITDTKRDSDMPLRLRNYWIYSIGLAVALAIVLESAHVAA
jgi:hypothetical protein